ncbi:DUF1440 domain-containing protein [Allosaccharopolyspora coralli]|uniref:DUF1440 domain-containing protein n=1 Tax=Allosaccharopolyspora coralli TaxID=2665642 RepID=A0A5Q3Q2L2_9PSEU|nr:DUF1440 domain-containing protein [Allosaccharopolyspora coralli]QGK68712.1 DUF1440 domain-containing protein [Allosaccharopolyspora coralli]
MRTAATVLEDLAVSAVAGYLGTKVMEPISMALYHRESEQHRAQEDEARPGPPFQVAAEKTAHLLGVTLHDQRLQQASMGLHYGLGISWAPLYALLRRHTTLPPLPAGLTMGTAMSLIADELLTPLVGFSAPNRAYPLVTHARGYAAHLAFGLAVASVTEATWCLRGRRA